VLRELYRMRDLRAQELDRPAFKVMGNRTLLEIAERKPRKLSELAEIKGITELLLRRLGRHTLAAVRAGRTSDHGPLPRLGGSGRRRMDRTADRRLAALKLWRTRRASELSMDPGVLCPNSGLEAIAWRNPRTPEDLETLDELKGWFVKSFGDEAVEVCRKDGESGEQPPARS
jgi:ribonuclease D